MTQMGRQQCENKGEGQTWEPSRADILRWTSIGRDASITAAKHLIRLDAKVTLFLERLVGSQTLYIYRNEDYSKFGLQEREFVPLPKWLHLCEQLGEPVLPWQWSNYTLKAEYWKHTMSELGKYGVTSDSSMSINEMNVLLRLFVKSGMRVQTHTYQVDRRKAWEVETKVKMWQQTMPVGYDVDMILAIEEMDSNELLGGALDFS